MGSYPFVLGEGGVHGEGRAVVVVFFFFLGAVGWGWGEGAAGVVVGFGFTRGVDDLVEEAGQERGFSGEMRDGGKPGHECLETGVVSRVA